MWLIAAIVAALAAAVLFVPIQLQLSIAKGAESSAARVRGRVRWLFVSFRFGEPARRRKPPKPAAAAPRIPRRLPPFIRKRLRAALTSPGFVRRTLRVVAAYLRLVKPDDVRIDVRAGFEDPADTGMFIGSALAASAAAGWRHVRITPEFLEPMLAGRVQLRWSRSLAGLVWPILPYAAFILFRRPAR